MSHYKISQNWSFDLFEDMETQSLTSQQKKHIEEIKQDIQLLIWASKWTDLMQYFEELKIYVYRVGENNEKTIPCLTSTYLARLQYELHERYDIHISESSYIHTVNTRVDKIDLIWSIYIEKYGLVKWFIEDAKKDLIALWKEWLVDELNRLYVKNDFIRIKSLIQELYIENNEVDYIYTRWESILDALDWLIEKGSY